MAKVVFSRKEFEKHIKITKEVEEKISLFGTHLESLTENEVEIEVLPNRPDLFSLQGFLRSFLAFTGKSQGLKKYSLSPPEKNFKVIIDSSVQNVRPFTVCAIVKNLSFNDEKIKEIIELQEKIHTTLGRNRKKLAIGIYPLEKISLPIKYTAKKPGEVRFRPLESNEEMSAHQILQKHPTGKTYAHLLEKNEKFPVFIDSKNNILSMPPIINSHETGKVDENTKSVFIECSGHHFETLNKTLNIIVTTLIDMGGKAYQMNLDYKKRIITPDFKKEIMKVSLEDTNKLLGLKLKENDLQKLLPKMGYDYKSGKVSVPPWRTDILHEVDLIEDIAIAYGYDKFNPEIPNVPTIASESKENRVKTKVSEILTGLGLVEVSSYHLIKAEEAENLQEEDKIEVENSKTEFKFLRPNLITPILRILSENKDNEYPQKIFEIGKVFQKDKTNSSETGIIEKTNLIIAQTPGNFTESKRILEYLIKMLGLEYKLEETQIKDFIIGRTGKIIISNNTIGYIGDIHPETLRRWNLKNSVSAIKISLDELNKVLSN